MKLGLALKVLTKTGAWYSYGKQHIAMGREAFFQALAQNAELRNELEQRITEQLAQPAAEEDYDYLEQPCKMAADL